MSIKTEYLQAPEERKPSSMSKLPSSDELPEALAENTRTSSIPIIWIIPIVAGLLGLWIAVKTVMQTGPTVTITFQTAEGLEAGKTKIRYKNVDIGEVTSITISDDRSKVVVKAQFSKEAKEFLVKDTRFWVERPRISGGHISGISTLLSGPYIAINVGQTNEAKRSFEGLEVAPILTDKLEGRQFLLEAQDLGSLDIGSPIFFRHIQVGEVIARELDQNGTDVHISVFIHAPYDKFVNQDTRFWNASGFDVSLDSNGIKLETQSITSILAGGIAFETPPNLAANEPAEPGSHFTLHKDRTVAMKTINGVPVIFELEFNESLRGLSVGAPVELRGIPIGEVKSVDLHYDAEKKNFVFPVQVTIHRERLINDDDDNSPAGQQRHRVIIDRMVDQGLRAQLRPGNLLTGQLYIAIDFVPDVPKAKIDWATNPRKFPTTPGKVEEFQHSISKILRKIEKIPFDEIGNTTKSSLSSISEAANSLNILLKHIDKDLTPESVETLKELRTTLAELKAMLSSDSPLQQDLKHALKDTSQAARSIRSLTETLDNQPESILRGKGDTD